MQELLLIGAVVGSTLAGVAVGIVATRMLLSMTALLLSVGDRLGARSPQTQSPAGDSPARAAAARESAFPP